MKKLSKLMSLVLALAMCLSLLPATALAVEETAYQVVLEADQEEVESGEQVNVAVKVVGQDILGLNIAVQYDTELFEAAAGKDDDGTGVITIADMGKAYANGETVETLTFTAKNLVGESKVGDFTTVEKQTFVTGLEDSKTGAAEVITSTPASVTVLASEQTWTVTFKMNGEQIGEPATVVNGGTLDPADLPTVPHCTINSWFNDHGSSLTTDQLLMEVIDSDRTFTVKDATWETYTVTLGAGLEYHDVEADKWYQTFVDDPQPATFEIKQKEPMEDLTVKTIGGPYDVSDTVVTYTIGDTTGTARDNGDGSYTILGSEITGDMTITATRTFKGYTVTAEEYVAGWTLVIVKENENIDPSLKTDGFYYQGGNQLHYVSDYEGYAIVIPKQYTAEQVMLNGLHYDGRTAPIITRSADVNGSGGAPDFKDAMAAYGCYNKLYNSEATAVYDLDQALYLRADVNGDHKLNADDVAAVQNWQGYQIIQ